MNNSKKRPTLRLIITIMVFFVASWLILGWLVYKNILPNEYLHYILLGYGIFNFLVLGFLLANHIGKKGFLVGLGAGIVVCGILLLIAFLGYEDLTLKLFVKYSLYTLGCSLGGALGVNLKKFV